MPTPRGLGAVELGAESRPAQVNQLVEAIRGDGGLVLAVYREPLGGHHLVFAGLPIERVSPTPFQRDLSEAHASKLADVIDRLDRFLDPIIAVRAADGRYWTPNGLHRLEALRKLGAMSVVALVLPEERVAYQILALNTEKAHNLRERALEAIRMERSLSEKYPERPEAEFSFEFEEAPLLTLGLCYEDRGRFSGGAYHSILKHTERFLDEPLPEAMGVREDHASRLLDLDDAVMEAAAALKTRGFDSPYLKAFVVARLNPLRGHRGAAASFDDVVERMLNAVERFDASSVRPADLARASGPPEE